MNALNNEKGAVLVTMLLLLLIITLIGIIATNVSVVDIQISANLRKESMAFGAAEAGVDIAIPIIEGTLDNNNTLYPASATGIISGLDTTNLGNEITGGADNDSDTAGGSPDITVNDINGATVKVDVDRLYAYSLPGSNVGFASGYEGIGAGSAGGGAAVLYRIDAQATRQ